MKTSVSYLVPSFNHAQYLPALLESIRADAESLGATTEIIIVDDGSRDASRAVIEAWVTSGGVSGDVITSFSAENLGIPATFNKLVDLAKGEFLRFCGSDDVIVRGSTRRLLNSFENDKVLVCAFGDALVVNERDEVLHRSSIAYHGGHVSELSDPSRLTAELIDHWCVAGPSILIRRSHYASMRYDETLKIDDYDLFLSLLELPGSVRFIDDVVCHYRIHLTNTSKTRDRQKRIDNMRSFLYIIEKYLKRGTLAPQLKPVFFLTRAKLNYLTGHYAACCGDVLAVLLTKMKMRVM